MELFAVSGSAVAQRTECAIVGVFEKGEFSRAGQEFDGKLGGKLTRLAKHGDLPTKLGDVLLLPEQKGIGAERLLLVGLGSKSGLGRKQYRRALTAALAAVGRTGAKSAVSFLSQEAVSGTDDYYLGRAAAEVVGAAHYRIPNLKTSKKPPQPALQKFSIAVLERSGKTAAQKGLDHGQAIFTGMTLTRDLANLPGNICTPTYLANAAKQLGRKYRSLKVQVFGESQIKKLKMGSFLSVTAGSDEPAKLIVIEYRGADRSKAPVALVGKGVTFDTGGISLKPPPAMDEMKFDMTGAASVLGALKAVAELKLPINLVVVVPTCENMPSGSATKPGDVVTSMSGQTIEVLNTDAEGRLILCDALTYVRRFKPDIVIDVATLTGACVIALGSHLSGLFSNDDELAVALNAAGLRADDRAWHMPIGEEYAEQLKSNFADMANVAGREGGAITAASFLSKFTRGLKWAHLDIAGTAWLSGAQKGCTGRPVPLLVDYLLNYR
jgi:leucyl aminopeptidase